MLKNLTFIPQLVEQQVRQPLVRVQGDDHVARVTESKSVLDRVQRGGGRVFFTHE